MITNKNVQRPEWDLILYCIAMITVFHLFNASHQENISEMKYFPLAAPDSRHVVGPCGGRRVRGRTVRGRTVRGVNTDRTQHRSLVPQSSNTPVLTHTTNWCRIFIMKVNIFRRWCDAKSKTTGKPTKVNLYLKILWVHFYRNVFFIYKVNSFNVNIEETFFVVCVWQPIRLEHGGMEDEF